MQQNGTQEKEENGMIVNAMSRRSLLQKISAVGAAGLLPVLLGDTPARAQGALTTVRIGGFGRSIPFIVAQREGFFSREGLNVVYSQVPSSDAQFTTFLSGGYDVISTAADNVANRYVNSQQAISIVAGVNFATDLVLIANTNQGVSSLADLKNKPIAVDAPDSGFVFNLRYILAQSGLYLENGDYSLQPVGGGTARYQAVSTGRTATGATAYAGLVNSPYTYQIAPPLVTLARFASYVSPFQSGVFAFRQDYLSQNPQTATSFLRAYLKADRFANDRANRNTVIADVAADQNASTALATTLYTQGIIGDNHKAELSKQGLISVLQLRRMFNSFNVALSDQDLVSLATPSVGGLYDDRFYRAARTSMGDPAGD